MSKRPTTPTPDPQRNVVKILYRMSYTTPAPINPEKLGQQGLLRVDGVLVWAVDVEEAVQVLRTEASRGKDSILSHPDIIQVTSAVPTDIVKIHIIGEDHPEVSEGDGRSRSLQLLPPN